MQEAFKQLLFGALKWMVVAPAIGGSFTLCLFQILDALEIKHYKGSKIKCWVYLSAFTFAFGQLIKFLL